MKICIKCQRNLEDSCFPEKSNRCFDCLRELGKQRYLAATKTVCLGCQKELDRTNFKKNSRYCFDCEDEHLKEVQEIESKIGLKVCKNCNKEKRMPDEIYYASFNCRECEQLLEEQRKNKVWKHPCKECGREFEVDAMKTWFICVECQEKREQKRIEENSKNICIRCNKEFQKDPTSRDYICDECKKLAIEQKKIKTTCVSCGEVYGREHFNLRKFICDDCSKKIAEKEAYDKKYRKCQQCGEDKEIGVDITKKSFFCFECVKKRRKDRANAAKETSWLRTCVCGKKIITTVPRATNKLCEECSERKKALRQEKKIRYINQKKYDYCQICREYKENAIKKNRTIVCEDCKPIMKEFQQSCFKDGKYIKQCIDCEKDFEASKERFWNNIHCKDCADPPENIKAGYKYGYRGTCSDGHKFSSLNEQDFDEWLVERNIKHDPHPRLEKTDRHADFYLIDYKLLIEIDGLDRQDDIDWYGKLSVYKSLGLELGRDYIILKPISKHYIKDKQVCFNELDKTVLPLLEALK